MIEFITRREGPGRRWLAAMWVLFGVILAAPLIAMQFTREVAWTAGDFAWAAVLLAATGLASELVVRSPIRTHYKIVCGALIYACLLFIWAQGAVGVF